MHSVLKLKSQYLFSPCLF